MAEDFKGLTKFWITKGQENDERKRLQRFSMKAKILTFWDSE